MRRILIPTITMAVVAGCTQMPPKPYEPEIRKDISYTFDSPLVKEQKGGITLSIQKSKLMDKQYKVNDCGYKEPAAAANAQTQPSPLSFGGSPELAFLTSVVSKATEASTTTKTTTTYDADGNPVRRSAPKFSIIDKSYVADELIVFDAQLKNEVNHVLKFDKAYFLLKDPAGNTFEPISLIKANVWLQQNSCATPEQKSEYLANMSIRNLDDIMLYPKESVDGYLAFRPSSKNSVGEWTLSVYELPVGTDAAGEVNVTDHFFSKGLVKKWETTLKKDSPKGEFIQIEKKEIK